MRRRPTQSAGVWSRKSSRSGSDRLAQCVAVIVTLAILATLCAPARAEAPGNRPAHPEDWDVAQSALCDSAVREAEQQHHLPPGLLGAIARAESGKPVAALKDVR